MNTISVIIPTLDRAKDLREMLHSLLRQTIIPDEVIIVDQSKNSTSKMQTESLFVGKQDIVLKYIHNSEITGAAQARNRGIDLAIGDVIFFFDDDVMLEKDYIEETLKVYEQYPEVAGVGGVITNYDFLNRPRIKLFNNIFFLGIFRDERRDIFANFKKYSKPITISKLPGGCVSYKKTILEKEKFDENFTGYSFGEDIDLSMRLAKMHKLYIAPKARLIHNPAQIKKACGEKQNYIYLETTSWTYIFLKNFRNNLFAWVCCIWLCLGWFLRGLLNVFSSNTVLFKNTVNGILSGISLFKGNRKASKLIRKKGR